MANHINYTTVVPVVIMYKECQRNHDVEALEKVLDGCGQFTASGPIGTPGAKVCAACHCHRNFHLRVVVELPQDYVNVPPFGNVPPYVPQQHPEHIDQVKSEGPESSDVSHQPKSPEIPKEGLNHQQQGGQKRARLVPIPDVKPEPGEEVMQPRSAEPKKRLTRGQSERLKAIARKNNWKIFREYSSEEVAEICSEIGIEKRSLKAWIAYHRSE